MIDIEKDRADFGAWAGSPETMESLGTYNPFTYNAALFGFLAGRQTLREQSARVLSDADAYAIGKIYCLPSTLVQAIFKEALAASAQSAEPERCATLCERFAADFTTTPPKNEFEHGVQTACVRLAEAFRRGAAQRAEPTETAAQAEPGLARERRDAAERTLGFLGYQWFGGEQWKSPLGAAKPAESAAQAGPVAWQWRRKDEPWTLLHTYQSEVFATTDDSEVRALYAHAPAQPEPAVVTKQMVWLAHNLCPHGLSTPDRMAWIADRITAVSPRPPLPPQIAEDVRVLQEAAKTVVSYEWNNSRIRRLVDFVASLGGEGK